MRRSWLIVAVLLIATFAALAQQPTSGTMNVRVTDNEGKPLPGATITVTGPLGQRAAQTDAEGLAELRFLPGGVYQLRVEMAGFAPMQYSKVGVNVGHHPRPGQAAGGDDRRDHGHQWTSC